MRIYAIYEDPLDREGAVLVKDGFSWPAFFLGAIWALYRRVWLGLVVYLALLVVLSAALAEPVASLAILGLHMAAGIEANQWRGRALVARGYRFGGFVTGSRLIDAERRYFERGVAAG